MPSNVDHGNESPTQTGTPPKGRCQMSGACLPRDSGVRISFPSWVGSGRATTTPDPRCGSENTRTFVFVAGQRTGSELACHYMGPAHHNGRFRASLSQG